MGKIKTWAELATEYSITAPTGYSTSRCPCSKDVYTWGNSVEGDVVCYDLDRNVLDDSSLRLPNSVNIQVCPEYSDLRIFVKSTNPSSMVVVHSSTTINNNNICTLTNMATTMTSSNTTYDEIMNQVNTLFVDSSYNYFNQTFTYQKFIVKGNYEPTLQLYAFTDKGSLDVTYTSATASNVYYQLVGADTNAIIVSLSPVSNTQRVEFDCAINIYVKNGSYTCMMIPITLAGVFVTSCG